MDAEMLELVMYVGLAIWFIQAYMLGGLGKMDKDIDVIIELGSLIAIILIPMLLMP